MTLARVGVGCPYPKGCSAVSRQRYHLVRRKMMVAQLCPLEEGVGYYSALRGASEDTEEEN